jgi:chromate transporter
LLIGLSWLYLAYGTTPLLAGLFYGIKPAVVAIVAHAAHRVGGKVLKNRWLWGIAVAAFIAIFVLHIPFPYIVLAAALAGYAGSRYAPQAFGGSGHGASAKSSPSLQALIDDATPTPAHAQFRWGRLLAVLGAGLALWALPLAALNGALGWEHTYTQMAWFFTKAALLTFGGAYAVLPYVYQGAVGQYGWLSPTQMVDGLALGESTPGPLIIVVAFVGFVGGYAPQAALAGANGNLALSGAIAACIVTWFTFLPSFIFILAGGPFVESTRGKLGFAAPLTAISAAVTGVIMNLALFFAYHVLWPQGFGEGMPQKMPQGLMRLDWAALGIALAAAVALFVYKRSVLQVLAGAALLGLLVHSLR